MSEKFEVLEPVSGPVGLLPGKRVVVRVRVKGEVKALAVYAQAYKERPPAAPKHKLGQIDKPGNYAGSIPGFIGEFRIKVLVELASGAKESATIGPFFGDQLAGEPAVNTVDILSPAPGHVSVEGENREFQVRVFAQGPDSVQSVVAQCRMPGGALLGMQASLDEDPMRPGMGEYIGRVFAPSSNPFRVKATGNFENIATGSVSPVEDEDGNYDA